jgi:peptidoglycan/LPS O-acetylase OafA/YrhL
MTSLDELVTRLEADNARRPVRVLVGAALAGLVVAAGALALDWQSEAGSLGVSARTGYGRAPALIIAAGVIALLLLGIGYRAVEQPAWTGWAAAASGIAVISCLVTLHGTGRDGSATGPAGWLALGAFAATTALAALAGLYSARRPSDAPAPPPDAAGTERQLRRALPPPSGGGDDAELGRRG